MTIAICAYNAERTIERAVRSAVAAGDFPILLVDDHSTDSTVEKAVRVGRERVTVVRPEKKVGIGNARQSALENIGTPYGMWLDADDEILPHRPQTMLKALQNADLAYDLPEVIDEASGAVLNRPEMPGFLEGPGIWRQLERNWLPGLFGAFRTNFARSIRFDCSFKNSEDLDFMLRALRQHARVQLVPKLGYRYYHSAGSVSRNLTEANHFTSIAISRHTRAGLEHHLTASSLSEAEKHYLLACHTLQCGDIPKTPDTALPDALEPYGESAEALIAFVTASAHALQGNWLKARDLLQVHPRHTADWHNNIGACFSATNAFEEAAKHLRLALELIPGYLDAGFNLGLTEGKTGSPAITRLPIRPRPVRAVYQRKSD